VHISRMLIPPMIPQRLVVTHFFSTCETRELLLLLLLYLLLLLL
jgi:hypothetical protein